VNGVPLAERRRELKCEVAVIDLRSEAVVASVDSDRRRGNLRRAGARIPPMSESFGSSSISFRLATYLNLCPVITTVVAEQDRLVRLLDAIKDYA
jgi:hypothetical protein